MSRLHPAQIRLLSFLALALADRFVDLSEIDRAQLVRSSDDLLVPSLIARGWAEMGPPHRSSVRITEAGRDALVGSIANDHAQRRHGAEGCGET